MLALRLLRVGKKNQPSFKLVVTDKRNPPRGGRFAEQVGFYNPLTKERVLNKEKIQYWLSKGVQPSPTVYNLLVSAGILQGKKKPIHKKSRHQDGGARPAESGGEKSAEAAAETAPVAEPQVKEEKKTEEKPVQDVPKTDEEIKKEPALEKGAEEVRVKVEESGPEEPPVVEPAESSKDPQTEEQK